MDNPILVEVTRGNFVESRHSGAVAVVDADGAGMLSLGDVSRPVFPRSAVKAIQALPLVECGAADRFGFSDADIALACASHSGEPAHASRADAMLSAAGLDVADLECGTHWPGSDEAARGLARAGLEPDARHNNCSGKHAGFLAYCRHCGHSTRGYVGIDHPVQQAIAGVMEDVTGHAHKAANAAIDGCSIPTYAVPLTALALGFARMGTGTGMGAVRALAARRILSACMAYPFEVGGTGTFDTRLLAEGTGRVFLKTGAEAVYCAAIPELGIGIALKIDDGSTRASESLAAAVIAHCLNAHDDLSGRFAAAARRPVLTRNGATVGEVRIVAGALG